MARGTRSSVFAFGRGAVIKVPEPTTPAMWIEQEAEYSALVHAIGAPVPRLLGVELHDGRPASVWERIGGPSLWERVVRAPGRSRESGRVLAEVQQGILALTAPLPLPRQEDRLRSLLRRGAPTLGARFGEVAALLPEPPAGRLCHGDLHPGNIILGRSGPVAVDWFNAARGQALGDIARSFLLLLPATGNVAPLHLPGASPSVLDAFAQGYLSALRETVELREPELGRWKRVQAVARVAEGVPVQDVLPIWTA